jgi:sugar lactone lactonase YvrE
MTAAVLYPDGSSKTFNLCMPGSFPNAQFVRMSRDGNSLLISDTSQRRVLRYWLKSNGDVHLFQKPTSGTACVPITL